MSSAAPADGGLRARRRALTELDIETAALAAVEADGFEATTMDQIAARAGVSVRTAFRYFPAKVDTVLFSARQVSLLIEAGFEGALGESPSLIEVEDSIAASLSALVESDADVIARLKRLRTLMLSDGRLRAEVAKSEGYQAGMTGIADDDGDNRLRLQLISEVCAATLRSAFDNWADAAGSDSELVAHYRLARELRDELVGRRS